MLKNITWNLNRFYIQFKSVKHFQWQPMILSKMKFMRALHARDEQSIHIAMAISDLYDKEIVM